MTITNISSLRKNLIGILDSVIEFNDPVTVTTNKGNAVIVSEADYIAMKETIYLASQHATIKEGEKENISSMSSYNPNEAW